jgi:streptogramin lyase
LRLPKGDAHSAGAVALLYSSDLARERLPIRAYSTADGLPDDEVDRIVTDPHGFLWFCTKGGSHASTAIRL